MGRGRKYCATNFYMRLLIADEGRPLLRGFYELLVSKTRPNDFHLDQIDKVLESWPSDTAVWNCVGVLSTQSDGLGEECRQHLFAEIVVRIHKIYLWTEVGRVGYPLRKIRRLFFLLSAMEYFKSPSLVSSIEAIYEGLLKGKEGEAQSLRRRAYLQITPFLCEICYKLHIEEYRHKGRKKDYALKILVDMLFQPEKFLSTFAFVTLVRIFLKWPKRRRKLKVIARKLGKQGRIDVRNEAGVGYPFVACLFQKAGVTDSALGRMMSGAWSEISEVGSPFDLFQTGRSRVGELLFD